jgi:hypothetical protein
MTQRGCSFRHPSNSKVDQQVSYYRRFSLEDSPSWWPSPSWRPNPHKYQAKCLILKRESSEVADFKVVTCHLWLIQVSRTPNIFHVVPLSSANFWNSSQITGSQCGRNWFIYNEWTLVCTSTTSFFHCLLLSIIWQEVWVNFCFSTSDLL